MFRLRLASLALAMLLGTGSVAAQTWQQLSPQQRAALAPLERDWATLDAERKQKWVEVAARMPSMSAAERQRIQARMTDWSRMTPDERGRARQRYQESRGLDARERQQRWEAYQALPAERRRELAQGGRPAPRPEARAPDGAAPQAKSNIVPNPTALPPPKQVAPNVMQAKPGATTTLLTRRPAPPPHQQTGLPKIAAQPGFVDRATLLPQRGPQAAATQPTPKAQAARDDKKR
jgi:hypothetical protein